MEGIGPGSTLGGRYVAGERLAQHDAAERWSAHDTTFGRDVVVVALPVEDHRAEAFLDAARRVAGLDTRTLVRILDVGRDDDVVWVVEEAPHDMRTLADLLADGGLPADEVRRISGEVATALETARHRGLHHLTLTAQDVLRTTDGEIRLRGLATDAALAGLDDVGADDAARRDAVRCVALTYAGLTGLWPLPGDSGGLAPAPRVLGGVASPSEIAAGIPRDLDAHSRLTLNDDRGPTSPGDYATQIAPWSTRQVVGRSTIITRPAGQAEPPARPVVEPSPSAAPSGSDDARVGTGATEPDDATVQLPVVPAGGAATGAAAAGAGAVGAGAAGPARADAAGAGARADAPDADPADADAADEPRGDHAGEDEPAEGDGSSESTQVIPVVPSAVAGAGAAVAGAVGAMGSRIGAAARRTADLAGEKAAERAAARREQREADAVEAEAARAANPGTSGLQTTTEELEAPAPYVPAQRLTRDESRVALGIVAGFLLIALVIGIVGVSRIGSQTDLDLGSAPAPATTSARPSASPTPSASSPAPTRTTAGSELGILGAEAWDPPPGDGQENSGQAQKVYDNDPTSEWTSERYTTENFGGLKTGLGIVVDLGPNVTPKQVTVVLGAPADIEVYVGPEKGKDGATKVASKTDANGTVTIPVTQKVSGQYVTVWFTKLGQDSQGQYRARVGEVSVTG